MACFFCAVLGIVSSFAIISRGKRERERERARERERERERAGYFTLIIPGILIWYQSRSVVRLSVRACVCVCVCASVRKCILLNN